MKVEDTISAHQRLREEEIGDDWNRAVEKGKGKERNEESVLICDYFMHSSIERERRFLDEKRVKWIARRMEMITKEVKERFQGDIGVEYRVDKQAVERKPATTVREEEMERWLPLETVLDGAVAGIRSEGIGAALPEGRRQEVSLSGLPYCSNCLPTTPIMIPSLQLRCTHLI
ncbi:hypothetical protein BYT27DRAFT_7201772 [Phlegmacium glaucopus]|nr:hypothetical protein BYT27DRAFT_7201772 [Phlegmacium glaucopus]